MLPVGHYDVLQLCIFKHIVIFLWIPISAYFVFPHDVEWFLFIFRNVFINFVPLCHYNVSLSLNNVYLYILSLCPISIQCISIYKECFYISNFYMCILLLFCFTFYIICLSRYTTFLLFLSPSCAVWPDKNSQMSIKVAPKWFH